jgi:hypothetical protein
MGLTARAKDLRRELDGVADGARHPALELGRFTTDAHVDRTDELTVPKREERAARLRRATLILAANAIFDECLDDYRELDDFEMGGGDSFPVRGVDETFVYRFFP